MLAATRSWKRQRVDSLLEPLEGTQQCLHLDFGPVRRISDVWPPELSDLRGLGEAEVISECGPRHFSWCMVSAAYPAATSGNTSICPWPSLWRCTPTQPSRGSQSSSGFHRSCCSPNIHSYFTHLL